MLQLKEWYIKAFNVTTYDKLYWVQSSHNTIDFGRTFQWCVLPGLYEINDITTACMGDDKIMLNILNKLHYYLSWKTESQYLIFKLNICS